ncbi:hypothetical protein J4E93_005696 [Alternaria ventricosa]|uniref:uncharacterized protein n=1 Tax=Alternaria ventricosa TaxID=1187951 RepID=UPI0020C5A8DD|nr:uncharacterized protein J4E93_005696 [Alternaria ventricosa]KAI4644898.1 hypothetical protein J4E93_005696 [Alternaria ventricosa]
MHPAPLPWLTALLRPRVKDFAGVYKHILQPMGMAAHSASYTRLTDTGEFYLQARADTKQSFVNNVYYSTASTETKRQLLEMPFEEFFDLCVRELPNAGDDLEDKSNDASARLWFLLSCATHSEADVDGSLGPELWKYYEWTTWWPNELSPTWYSTAFEEQSQAFQRRHSKMWPGLTRFLEDGIRIQDGYAAEDIEHIIKHFLWLLLNTIDVHHFDDRHSLRARYPPQAVKRVIHEGYEVLFLSSKMALQNPFSDIPKPVREALATVNTRGNIEFLAQCPLRELYDIVAPELFHATVYINFLYYALAEVDRLKADPNGTIRANLLKLHMVGAPKGMRPDHTRSWTRPAGMGDVVTVELEAYILRHLDNGPAVDVPIEPTGPRIDLDRLCDVMSTPIATERCPICLEDYADVDNVCVQLKACAHLLHRGCLDELVNGVYPGVPEIRCPACRTGICGARDYTAVLDNEVRDEAS